MGVVEIGVPIYFVPEEWRLEEEAEQLEVQLEIEFDLDPHDCYYLFVLRC